MSSPAIDRPLGGYLRGAISATALAVLLALGVYLARGYVDTPSLPRPHDFLQVWSAGRLNLGGNNPYDGERMYALQVTNRMPDCRTAERPAGYASMMWVPPWGLAVAMPVGALPVDLAQLVWVYGQLAVILAGSVVLWRLYGGAADRRWVAAALALGSGPVWWQTVGGQYAGVLFVGVVGYLAAHRAHRPLLAGAFVALTALKPHLFTLLAVGLCIDALRTPFGRRVVLGGVIALGAAAAVGTATNPHVWDQYAAATSGEGSAYYPGLTEWFNPTVQAWVRHAFPGRPFWVQFVPLAAAVPVFAAYWWRHGGPDRWPAALPWVLPVCLLVAPYGSWPSDQVLFLVPVIALAVRIGPGAIRFAPPDAAVVAFAAANAAVVVMTASQVPLHYYVWVAPTFCACLVLKRSALERDAVGATASAGGER
ncbi:glycosyltransferase family 87 protein [Frigoriglobus tundricola]|uniref:DUF2029 domain-containing protein n=1 Tax=Frigoriglobus tundricola TaxID=2774151 RepID=A0A6M5YFM2_9BACT|nr:glycosyltransferase family 87 protein [Frigoriglobus tundricola]QJW92807.1 hypothetical protein FTUN_0304 [Frigoriglobus tundricola]